MYIVGKVTKVNKRQVLLETDADIDLRLFQRLSNGKQPSVGVNLNDQRLITADQRNKFWALIGDYCEYTGFVPSEAEDYFKTMYEVLRDGRKISLSVQEPNAASVEEATEVIQLVIDFMFEQEIPFKTANWDWIRGDYAVEINCLMHRECIVCGAQHCDIAHYETVGSGRNRHHVDHRDYHFMALCRKHHIEQHTKGLPTFCEEHQIKPVKMTAEQLIKVGLMTKSKILKFDREKQDEQAAHKILDNKNYG